MGGSWLSWVWNGGSESVPLHELDASASLEDMLGPASHALVEEGDEASPQPWCRRHAAEIRRNSVSAASSSLIVGLGRMLTSFFLDASDVGLRSLLDVSKADFVSLRGAGRTALLALRAALDLGDAFGDALRKFFRAAGSAAAVVDRGGVAALVTDAAGLGGAPSSENSDEVGDEGMSLSASDWPFCMAHARRVACACDDCRCSISGVTFRL